MIECSRVVGIAFLHRFATLLRLYGFFCFYYHANGATSRVPCVLHCNSIVFIILHCVSISCFLVSSIALLVGAGRDDVFKWFASLCCGFYASGCNNHSQFAVVAVAAGVE